MNRIKMEGIAAFLFLFSIVGCAPAAETARPSDFTLADLGGAQVTLSSFAGKQPVLLMFWTTWCPYCRAGLKDIVSGKYPGLADAGVKVLAINISESPQQVKAFVESNKIKFTVLLDAAGTVAQKYSVVGIPTYVLLNKAGASVYEGNEFPRDLTALLKER